MGCPFDPAQGKGSPLYVNPVNVLNTLIKVLAEDKGRRQGYGPQERCRQGYGGSRGRNREGPSEARLR
jgi:hypothetical protein